MLARVLQAAGSVDRKQGDRHDHGLGHRDSHAFRLRKGGVERRRDAAAGGEAPAIPVGASRAKRLNRGSLDAGASGIRAADAGAGSGRHVASGGACRDAAGHKPLGRSAAKRTKREETLSRYARYECLNVEVAEKVATVTLNRPQARNAINQKLIRELRTIWDDLGDDQ